MSAGVSDVRSGALAAWARAWLDGTVSIDQVVDAVTRGDGSHHVLGLAGSDLASLHDLLVLWRRTGAEIQVALPAPGDVRGLPGPADFRSAALNAGEAAMGGALAVVPEVTDYAPSSAPPSVVWDARVVEPAPLDHQSIADAQYELTTAIRESASALASADVAGGRERIGELLGDARRAGEHVNLPPGHPPRAVALLAQAQRLQAVLDLAVEDPHGGAIDTAGVAARAGALRPLATAVRRARAAAYNAPR